VCVEKVNMLLCSVNKQDRQFAYNVILRCVRATIFAVEKH